MITIVYQLIVAMAIAIIVWELFTQKDIKMQANAAIVLIPLILRVLMVG